MKRFTIVCILSVFSLAGCASSQVMQPVGLEQSFDTKMIVPAEKHIEQGRKIAVAAGQDNDTSHVPLKRHDRSVPPTPFEGLGGAERLLPGLLIARPGVDDDQDFVSLAALPDASKGSGGRADKAGFDIRDASVVRVLDLIYSTGIKTPYVLSPDVMQDSRPVSFRWSTSHGDIQSFMVRFLDSLGYKVESRDGVDYVLKRTPADEPGDYFIYRPSFRSVKYLTNLVSPYFSGYFGTNRQVSSSRPLDSSQGVVPSNSVAALIDQDADTLIFKGRPSEIEQLKRLLAQLDVPGGEVLVRGLVYEVGVNQSEGSAFSLITSLFDGKLNIGLASGSVSPASNFIAFKNVTIDLVANMLSNDSRFKVVSSPSIRMTSGVRGAFSVGQDVPVLGSVSYDGNGNAVQSVEYRSSGVIFNVLPNVYEEKVVLDINQELSNFIRTETGVDGSPTLTKRELNTSVSVSDGELIVLGGLAEFKDNNGRSGFSFLPDFMRWNTSTKQRSEIVLVVQVQRL